MIFFGWLVLVVGGGGGRGWWVFSPPMNWKTYQSGMTCM